MFNIGRTTLSFKIRNSLALGEVTVENRADASGLAIEENKGRAIVSKQEVDFLQCLLGCFLWGER